MNKWIKTIYLEEKNAVKVEQGDTKDVKQETKTKHRCKGVPVSTGGDHLKQV